MPFCCREEPGCHLAAPFELTCLQDLPPPSQGTGWAELLGPGGQPPRCRLSHQFTASLGRTPHSTRQLCDHRHVTQALCAPSGLVCQMGPGMLTPVNRTDNRERKARGAGAWRAAEAQSTVTALGGCYATARQGRAARPCWEGQPPPGMDGRAGNALTEAAAAELGPAGVGAGTRGRGEQHPGDREQRVPRPRGRGEVAGNPGSRSKTAGRGRCRVVPGHLSASAASSAMPQSRWVTPFCSRGAWGSGGRVPYRRSKVAQPKPASDPGQGHFRPEARPLWRRQAGRAWAAPLHSTAQAFGHHFPACRGVFCVLPR